MVSGLVRPLTNGPGGVGLHSPVFASVALERQTYAQALKSDAQQPTGVVHATRAGKDMQPFPVAAIPACSPTAPGYQPTSFHSCALTTVLT